MVQLNKNSTYLPQIAHYLHETWNYKKISRGLHVVNPHSMKQLS